MGELPLPLLAVLLGYTVLGLTGFGSALVTVPLLTWVWPLLALGVYVAVVGLRALRSGQTHSPVHERWGVVYGIGIGAALAGVWLGHRLAHRVPVARLRQIICALLVLSGSVLAAKALG